MEFPEVQVCQFVPSLNLSYVETKIIEAEISKLLSKGVMVNTIRERNNHVPWIFTRTKKDGNYRMILYLKTFNKSIKDAFDLATEGCYVGSANLKEPCYGIPVHENYKNYLKLFWTNEYYQYILLPNGFSPAVTVFTKVLTLI